MIELPLSRPSNRFLVRQRDRRWVQALAAALLLAALLSAVLFAVGWPRLKATSIHYEIVRLRSRVAVLERRERALETTLAELRDPVRLGEQARELGLVPPSPDATHLLAPGREER